MPKLNLNVSVWSVLAFVIGWASEKLIGPKTDNQSIPTPIEVLIVFELSREEL